MDWSWLGHFEWIILEVLFLGLLVWELISVRRSIRDDKKKADVMARDGEE